jgi:hypothetical protein
MGAAMFGDETIGQRLTATRGRTTGFDYLRAGLKARIRPRPKVLLRSSSQFFIERLPCRGAGSVVAPPRIRRAPLLPPDTNRILCYLAGAPVRDRRLPIRHLRSDWQQANANSGQRRREAGTKGPHGEQ